MQLKIGITDALQLIPEFIGEKNEINFVYFREGCKNALKVLGTENEALLLMFLKKKLKGNAYTRFALKLTTYEKLSPFLEDLKKIYAWRCDSTLFWVMEMMELQQKENESIHEYSAQFQELLQCAIIGIQNNQTQQISSFSKESELRKIEEMEIVAATHFVKNLTSDHIRDSINAVHKSPKSLMEIIHSALAIESQDRKEIVCSLCDDSDHSESECYMREGYDYFIKHCQYCDENGHLEENCPLLVKCGQQRSDDSPIKRKSQLCLNSQRYNKRNNQTDSDTKSDQSSSTNSEP